MAYAASSFAWRVVWECCSTCTAQGCMFVTGHIGPWAHVHTRKTLPAATNTSVFAHTFVYTAIAMRCWWLSANHGCDTCSCDNGSRLLPETIALEHPHHNLQRRGTGWSGEQWERQGRDPHRPSSGWTAAHNIHAAIRQPNSAEPAMQHSSHSRGVSSQLTAVCRHSMAAVAWRCGLKQL